jgi:hypothetical protein
MANSNINELPSIITQENFNRETTKQKHWREIEIFTGILNVFTSGFNYIGSFVIKNDKEAEDIWLLLVTRSLHSIKCSIDLMLKGYYSQAMSLLRTGTEAWFICKTAKDNQAVRDCLLTGKVKMPKYSKLAGEAGAMKLYRGDYAYQSKFIHSSKLSLRVLQDPNTNEMRIAPVYDEMLFLLCSESLIRVSILMLEYMGYFLFYIDKNKAKSWDNENGQRIKDASNWLMELRNKYGKRGSHATTEG